MENIKIINKILKNIEWFEKYCRKELWNSFENWKIDIDFETLLYHLKIFTKNNFLDSKYILCWNNNKFYDIINELNNYYNNPNTKEIINIIYFEWFYFDNPKYINNFINLIKFKDIKNNLEKKINIWLNIKEWENNIEKEIKILNNLIYSNFWRFLFIKIKWFKEYFYENGYDDEDLISSYTVCSCLIYFIKHKFLDENFNIIWNKKELNIILKIFNIITVSNNSYLSTLWVIWFIEWLSQQVDNQNNMNNLRKILFYHELQKGLDDVNNFWNWKIN